MRLPPGLIAAIVANFALPFLLLCAPAPFATPLQQSAGGQGLVSIEAENYDANVSQGGHSWTPNTTAGYSGAGAVRAFSVLPGICLPVAIVLI